MNLGEFKWKIMNYLKKELLKECLNSTIRFSKYRGLSLILLVSSAGNVGISPASSSSCKYRGLFLSSSASSVGRLPLINFFIGMPFHFESESMCPCFFHMTI